MLFKKFLKSEIYLTDFFSKFHLLKQWQKIKIISLKILLIKKKKKNYWSLNYIFYF